MAFDWEGFLQHPGVALGAGIMAGSDPNRQGLGGLGMGILGASQSFQNQQLLKGRADDRRAQARYREFQMDQAKQQAGLAEQQRQAQQAAIQGIQDPQQQAMARAFPSQFATSQFKGPTVVPKGGSVYDGGQFQQPQGTRDPGDWTKALAARRGLQKDDATFSEVSNRARQIKTVLANPGPFSDVALVNNIAKFLDPGSVVRPGETETIKKAGGLINSIEAALSSAVGKGPLTTTVRKDIAKTMNKLMEIYRKEYRAKRKDMADFLSVRGAPGDIQGYGLSFPEFPIPADPDTVDEGAEIDALIQQAEQGGL